PPLAALGEGSHGSILNGNYAPNRLSSAWKPTAGDRMILRPGFKGTWEVVETTRKDYVIKV
ncbi:UNVERIFIED_ORG: putative cupin superfamily protein, partial [Rhizobium sophorae]|uniref:cupin domain-containing protein n=1 Tax=Rhizobium leguminosarum TaxID=384 RepID=UPI001811D10B